MNRRILLKTGLACLIPIQVSQAQVPIPSSWDRLLNAIRQVETGGSQPPYRGDYRNGVAMAWGPYQIWPDYWRDGCEYLHRNYSLTLRDSPIVSRVVVQGYLCRYGRAYERETRLPASARVLARIHNGGPSGWKNPRTIAYASKVLAAMK